MNADATRDKEIAFVYLRGSVFIRGKEVGLGR